MESLVGSVSEYLKSKLNKSKKDLLPTKKGGTGEGQGEALPPVGQKSNSPPRDNEGHDGYYWS